MAHVIVIGGSSKLDEVSYYLAQNDNIVSVISRSRKVLETFAKAADSFAGKINLISVKSHDPISLKATIKTVVEKFGPVTLVVSWIGKKAREVIVAIAEYLNTSSPVCRFFAIEGNHAEDLSGAFKEFDRVLYRKIFYKGNKDKAGVDDLSPKDFTAGIINAIREDYKDSVLEAK